jgi:lipopolysaccharide export system protein LptA
MKPVLGFLASIALLIQAPCLAQGQPSSSAATRIQSDQLQHDDQRQVTVFSGNVSLTRDGLVLNGDRLELTQRSDGSSVAILNGRPARFTQQRVGSSDRIQGSSGRLEYDSKTEIVVLIGAAQLRRSRGDRMLDEVVGDQVTYNTPTETYEVKASQGQGRAQMTLMPREAKP